MKRLSLRGVPLKQLEKLIADYLKQHWPITKGKAKWEQALARWEQVKGQWQLISAKECGGPEPPGPRYLNQN